MDEIEALFNEAAAWSDERLTAEPAEAALGERRSLLGLLIRLSEFDRRKLPETKGYPSAYEYCARILKHFLTSDNHERLLRRASGRGKEEVERMVASLDPKRAR